MSVPKASRPSGKDLLGESVGFPSVEERHGIGRMGLPKLQ